MATTERDHTEPATSGPEAHRHVDPRDTDHPTGPKQAAENAANDSPS